MVRQFNKRFDLLKTQIGFSLVELMVAVAIGGGLTLGLTSMLSSQNKNSVDQQVILARMDFEKFVIDSFSNGSICTFILNDSSQSTAATPSNRSADTFDATVLTVSNPAIIDIKNYLIKASANAPSFATVGKPASLLSNKLIISKMKFSIRPNQPPDIFIADFEVEFNQPLGKRSVNNIIIKDIQITTDSTSPINAKRIIGCGGLGEAIA